MNNDGAKRLSLLLTLNPTISEADRFAINTLKAWYQQAKQSKAVDDDLQATVKQFHRDIYLAGLFLHQLHSGLASNLANLLTEKTVSLPTLLHQLNCIGLEPADSAKAEETSQQLSAIHTALLDQNPNHVLAEMMQQLQTVTSMLTLQQEQLQQLAALRTDSKSASNRHREQAETHALPGWEVQNQMKKIKQKGLF